MCFQSESDSAQFVTLSYEAVGSILGALNWYVSGQGCRGGVEEAGKASRGRDTQDCFLSLQNILVVTLPSWLLKGMHLLSRHILNLRYTIHWLRTAIELEGKMFYKYGFYGSSRCNSTYFRN